MPTRPPAPAAHPDAPAGVELQAPDGGGTPGQQGAGLWLDVLSAAAVGSSGGSGGCSDGGSGGSGGGGGGDGSPGGHPGGPDGRDPQKKKILRREGRFSITIGSK